MQLLTWSSYLIGLIPSLLIVIHSTWKDMKSHTETYIDEWNFTVTDLLISLFMIALSWLLPIIFILGSTLGYVYSLKWDLPIFSVKSKYEGNVEW